MYLYTNAVVKYHFEHFFMEKGAQEGKTTRDQKVIMWSWLLSFQISQTWTLRWLCTPVLWSNIFPYGSSQFESGVQLLETENISLLTGEESHSGSSGSCEVLYLCPALQSARPWLFLRRVYWESFPGFLSWDKLSISTTLLGSASGSPSIL